MKFKWDEKKFWEIRNKIYSFFLQNFIPYHELIENVIEELNLKPGFYILDAGCGSGIFVKRLMEKKVPNVKVEAIDISEKILQVAKKNNLYSENVSFQVMDLNKKLKFKDQTFDAVVCINVLFLLKKPLDTLLEFHRVLKEKGKVILTIPKDNFSYKILFKEHFLKRKGLKKIRDAIIFIFILGAILPFELIITLREKKGKYKRFNERDIIKLFHSTPFRHFKITESYAKQNFLIIAEK